MPKVKRNPIDIDNLVKEMIPSYEELELIPTPADSDPHSPVEDEVTVTLRKMHHLLEDSWISGEMERSGQYCLVGAAQYEGMGVIRDYFSVPDSLDNWVTKDNAKLERLRIVLGLTVLAWINIPRWVASNCNRTYRKTIRALKRQGGFLTVVGLIKFNDEKGKAAVLHLIDKTIESRTK